MDNSYYILEKPIEIININIITKYKIYNISLIPFKQAYITVNLYNKDNKMIECKYLIMSGDDYNNWNEDDEYLINWINEELKK